jgi:hypothetical protein
MIKSARRLCFAAKTGPKDGVHGKVWAKPLNRDGSPELGIKTAVNL